MNKSTTPMGRLRPLIFMVCAFCIVLIMTGCGTTKPKCGTGIRMDDGDNHFSYLAEVRTKALDADIPDGFMDVMADGDMFFTARVK